MCATLRSEFLKHALASDEAVRLFRRQFPVAPVQSERLREVIVRPAERAAVSFEPELVERILADTSGPDALPLLSYTLELLCRRQRQSHHDDG